MTHKRRDAVLQLAAAGCRTASGNAAANHDVTLSDDMTRPRQPPRYLKSPTICSQRALDGLFSIPGHLVDDNGWVSMRPWSLAAL